MDKYDRYISRHHDGRWAVRRGDSVRRYNTLHATKEEALAQAQRLVDHFGGKVRIAPGADVDPAIREQMAKEALERHRIGIAKRFASENAKRKGRATADSKRQ